MHMADLQDLLDASAGELGVVGATVGVFVDDEVHVATTGVGCLATEVPVRPDTMFRSGSIGKLYTATLVLQLIADGRLELTDPIRQHVPEFSFRGPADSITVEHLLTHSAGIDGDYWDGFGRGADAIERYVRACAQFGSLFRPGKRFSYSNSAFVLLGRLVENIRDRPWADVLHDELLQPLELRDTTVFAEQLLARRVAVGHYQCDDTAPRIAQASIDERCAEPAGTTIHSTAADLLAFGRAYFDRRLPAEVTRPMQTPRISVPDGGTTRETGQGLGWKFYGWADPVLIGHNGGSSGQAAILRVFPDEHVVLAVLTNTVPAGGELIGRIESWFYRDVLGMTLRPELQMQDDAGVDLDAYCGTYSRHDAELRVRRNGDHLEISGHGPLAMLGDRPQTLHPADDTRFLPGPIVFDGFGNGRPQFLYQGPVASRRVDSV
jgi:CubicO group peptidase (beta-lactamase class C family)